MHQFWCHLLTAAIRVDVQCGISPDSIHNSWWRCFYGYREYIKTVSTLLYVICSDNSKNQSGNSSLRQPVDSLFVLCQFRNKHVTKPFCLLLKLWFGIFSKFNLWNRLLIYILNNINSRKIQLDRLCSGNNYFSQIAFSVLQLYCAVLG